MSTKGNSIFSRAFGHHYFVIALTVCVIFVLMGLLSERLEHEFDQVEQVQFEYRLSELKAVVRLMEADLHSQGKLQESGSYEGANPMDWLKDDTSHYLGEMQAIDAIAYPGQWFFDVQSKTIAFVPYELKGLESKQNKNENLDKILRFKVRALRSKEINSKYSGLVLEQLNDQ